MSLYRLGLLDDKFQPNERGKRLGTPVRIEVGWNSDDDRRFPVSKEAPATAPQSWYDALRLGDEVEVRATFQCPHGRILGVFPIEWITPSRRFHAAGWVFDRRGEQFGAYGPGCAAIFPRRSTAKEANSGS